MFYVTDEAERLKGMPNIVTHFEFGPLDGTYILPPIKYPDGKTYLKVFLLNLTCRSLKGKILCLFVSHFSKYDSTYSYTSFEHFCRPIINLS